MYKHLFKIAVFTITILTVNLVSSSLSDYMATYKWQLRPITFTLVGMGIITVIFYPLFLKLEDWINILSARIVRTGNSVAGKYIGLLISFTVCLTILFYFYAKMWYKIDMFKYIVSLL